MFAKCENGITKTRVKNNTQLTVLDSVLDELRAKKSQLDLSVKQKNKSSPVYQKHAILTDFLVELDQLIDNYNDKYTPNLSISDDTIDLSNLLISMLNAIARIKANQWEIIFTHRSNNSSALGSILKYGTIFAGSAASTAAFGPVTGAGLFFGSLVSSLALSKLAGSDTDASNNIPETANLLIKLQNSVIALIQQNSARMGAINLFEQHLNCICLTPVDISYLTFKLPNHDVKLGTLYLYPIDSGNAMECAYKTKHNKIMRLDLRRYLDLDESVMLALKEHESLGVRQYSAVTTAIYRIFCSPDLNNLTIWQQWNVVEPCGFR